MNRRAIFAAACAVLLTGCAGPVASAGSVTTEQEGLAASTPAASPSPSPTDIVLDDCFELAGIVAYDVVDEFEAERVLDFELPIEATCYVESLYGTDVDVQAWWRSFDEEIVAQTVSAAVKAGWTVEQQTAIGTALSRPGANSQYPDQISIGEFGDSELYGVPWSSPLVLTVVRRDL